MAAIKCLGQLEPTAATLTALYTSPSASLDLGTIVGLLVAMNTGGSSTLVRASLAIAGAADATVQHFVRDVAIGPGQCMPLPVPISMAPTDVLRVYSLAGGVIFHAYGQEL